MSNVISKNGLLAERHFAECLFSRTSFSRIAVQRNIILPNRRLAECHFPETSFSRTAFPRKGKAKCHFTEVFQLCILLILYNYSYLSGQFSIF